MKNKELNYFTRNNYFKGKQLTARDFKDEQSYGIDKRRLANLYLNGFGVVSGLDVVAIDNTAVSIESGYAVDGLGRDIFIVMPIVKNVNLIDGYESLDDSKNIYLCIEYKETFIEPTYSLSEADEAFNRIKEGYNVFVTNKRPSEYTSHILDIVQTKTEIYDANGVSVRMTVPKYVKYGDILEVAVEIEKRNITSPLSVGLIAESKFFTADNSGKLEYYNAGERFDRFKQKINYTPVKNHIGIAEIKVSAENVIIKIDDEELKIGKDVIFKVEIIENDVSDLVTQKFFQYTVDEFDGSASSEPIYLAELCLMKVRNNCYIEHVTPLPFGHYIMSSRLAFLLSSVIPGKPAVKETVNNVQTANVGNIPVKEKLTAGGEEVLEISVDMKGKVYYSSEIIHGLGAGSVSYSIGFGSTITGFSGTSDAVVFGEPDLFDGSSYSMDFPNVKYGIISYNDRGSFRIAVKLLDRINCGSIKIHWYAYKHKEYHEKILPDVENVSILIKPNLVNLAPREKITFDCIIEGTDDLNCIWAVEDENGGVIDRNGVYEAPSTEGVYTISATSAKYPGKKAVNYIIVSKTANN